MGRVSGTTSPTGAPLGGRHSPLSMNPLSREGTTMGLSSFFRLLGILVRRVWLGGHLALVIRRRRLCWRSPVRSMVRPLRRSSLAIGTGTSVGTARLSSTSTSATGSAAPRSSPSAGSRLPGLPPARAGRSDGAQGGELRSCLPWPLRWHRSQGTETGRSDLGRSVQTQRASLGGSPVVTGDGSSRSSAALDGPRAAAGLPEWAPPCPSDTSLLYHRHMATVPNVLAPARPASAVPEAGLTCVRS